MADVSYNIPDLRPGEVFRVEQTIKRSRFIASVGHTSGAVSYTHLTLPTILLV